MKQPDRDVTSGLRSIEMLLNSATGEGIVKQTKICYLPKCERIRRVFLNSAAEKCNSLAGPLLPLTCTWHRDSVLQYSQITETRTEPEVKPYVHVGEGWT